jgi:lipopolysaccharide transport system ATP-binding protein
MKAIKVENLSKAYQLGQIGTGTISRDIERWAAKIRGKEDPFLKIGETNDRAIKGTSDIVWSLKDLNFEIEQGDAVGIIGRNGAGKSTLLKLLSRVTAPTTGNIKIKGRVASLLEVGTGFHPELSGRENIYLNGAILGMRKKEITRQLDEIVDFAGVERYLDTPVKRYSSGMYVRLAFAVAAHLETEILIVDEVLAVGDAEFQKKCVGKMNDVGKGQGRTVLFVSHNMGTITQLCESAILLDKGVAAFQGRTKDAIEKYMNSGLISTINYSAPKDSFSKGLYIETITLLDHNAKSSDNFLLDKPFFIEIEIGINDFDSNVKISITLQNLTGDYLSTFVLNLSDCFYDEAKKKIRIKIKIFENLIAPNSYALRIALFLTQGFVYDLVEMVCPFRIVDSGSDLAMFEGRNYGSFIMNYQVV